MPCAFHAERTIMFALDAGCQFETSGKTLIEVDGEMWCQFHAPLKDKGGNSTPKGVWGHEQIEKFNHAVHSLIDGAREKDITCDLTGVIFPDRINMSGKKIPPASFYKVEFHGSVDFEGAEFLSHVEFKEAIFFEEVKFGKTKFDG